MATLAQMRTRCLQRADMEYNATASDSERFATDDEVDGLINVSYKKLYSELARNGMHRSESDYTIAADNSATYDLPADLWAVLTVHRLDNSGVYIRLNRHDVRHRSNAAYSYDATSYRVIGSQIEFSPRPPSGTYVVRYVPVPGELTADADVLDGVLGWEEFVVVDVAIQLRLKEEAGVEELVREREMLRQRIQDDAQAAEMVEGQRVVDVRFGEYDALPGSFIGSYRPEGWRW